MSKKMRELLNSRTELLNKANDLIGNAEAKKEDIEKLQNEIETLNSKIATQKIIDDGKKFDDEGEEVKEATAGIPQMSNKPDDSIKTFAKAARRLFNVLEEGTPASGGYTVPEDISTKIEKLRDSEFSLRSLVRVTPVKTNSGARTFQKKATQTGFTTVGEGTAIGAKDTPKFERVPYSIKKYAGYMPATDELLSDSDANIVNVITEWIAGEARATDNSNIIAALATIDATDLKDLDGIKKALNVTLGGAYKSTSSIITNDDGIQYLDTLRDGDGRYLLSHDPTNPKNMRLSVGVNIIPIENIPNAILTTSDNKVPFIIGDLKEAIWLFDRQSISIKSSDTAIAGSGASQVNAFDQDMTLFRGILRQDVQVRDKNAVVNGYITVAQGV